MENLNNFQKLFREKVIKTRKNAFNEHFSKYKFYLIRNEDDFTDEIASRLSTSEIILIDEIEYNNEHYYVICMHYAVIVISINSFHFCYYLLIDHNSIFFTSSTKTYDHISKQIQSISSTTSKFLNKFNCTEIDKYSEEIQILNKCIELKGRKQILEWKIIQKSISSYLIIFSHQWLKIDRISNLHHYFKEDKLFKMNEEDIEILKRLGGISNVYLIYNIKLEYLFIMKLQRGDEETKLYNREIENYKNVHHPFLLKFIGEVNYESNNYMILEYIEGPMLCEIKNESIQLNQSEKIKIIFQIMIVLEYIHNNNYVYRDLKPNNVILNYAKIPILIDLDRMVKNVEYSKSEDSTKDFGHQYIAPEIISSGTFSFKSDIYSLGILVYFLILEKNPPLNGIDENIFNDLKNANMDLKKIFENCIKIDPNQRPELSQLINDFYFECFSKIPPLISETNTIKSIKNIHSLKYCKYWVFISEFNHNYAPIDIFLLNIENNILPDDINIAFKYLSQKITQYITKDIHYENDYLYYLALADDPDCLKLMMYLGNYYGINNYKLMNIEKSIHYYTKAANNGDPMALFNLGCIYFNDKYGHQDINKAIQYFTLSSNQNNSFAQYNLAVIYYQGINVNKDINKAIHYFKLSANGGYVISQFELGDMYYHGKNVVQNIYESIKYFELAAKQNHAKAQNNLGVIYFDGKYIRKDIEKAIYYFTLAAKNGVVISQYNLGIIYYSNECLHRDINKAIYYFTQAANNNHIEAACILGNIYFDGIYVKRDIEKAIFFNQFAASKNNLNAIHNLGIIYFNGNGTTKDVNKGIKYLTISANQNHINSNCMLGYIYYAGVNVEQNIPKSISFFENAANHNSKEAQFTLGTILYNENIRKSIYYLTLSANNNCVYAQHNLGLIFLEGQKVLRDIEKSIYYFTCAANQNCVFAQFNLGIIYESDQYIQRNIDKSISYYSKAANQNFAKAQYNLGCIYLYGQYVTKDIDRSIHYFTLAADQNMPEAQFNLGCIYFFTEFKHMNLNKAIHFFSQSANQGYALAIHNLGYIYFQLKLYNKAIYFYLRAAEKNYDESQFVLGCIYYNGNIVQKDMKKALKYLTESADQHNPNAQICLGILYYNGVHVQRNINKSIHYFSLLADNYNKHAQYFLGYIFYEGNQIEQNIEKSIYYYKESSSLNNYYSKNNLAIIYKHGFGVDKNIQYAEELLIEAYKINSNEILIYNLAHLYLFEKDKNDLDKCINLLLKKPIGKLSLILLCLAFVTKYHQITLNIISDEIKNYSNIDDIQPEFIFEEIKRRKLMNCKNYVSLYNYIHDIDFMFNFDQNSIISFFNTPNSCKNSIKHNIENEFYDGFGIIIH